MKGVTVVAMMVASSVVLGCEGARQDDTVVDDTAAAAPAPTAAPAADTTADALWARLQQENFTSWALWPGKQKYYQGQEPHGALLITYVNSLAQDAITNGAAQMPAGAVIVKENYGPDRVLMATTVMTKVTGYDAQNHDWFWAKYRPDGSVELSGRAEMCYACHQGAAQYDLLWTLAKDKTGQGPPPTKMQ